MHVPNPAFFAFALAMNAPASLSGGWNRLGVANVCLPVVQTTNIARSAVIWNDGGRQIPLRSVPSIPITSDTPTKRALCALSTLQTWYNSTRLWDTAGWWNGANIMTIVGNLAQADPENKQLQNLAKSVFVSTVERAPTKNPQPGVETENQGRPATSERTRARSGYKKVLNSLTYEPHTFSPANWISHHRNARQRIEALVSPLDTGVQDDVLEITFSSNEWLDGYYDDDLWWALAWITAYDVTDHTSYLSLAEGIFRAVARTWPTHCHNGGIYWNLEKNYVNAISNELFLSTAVHLANRVDALRQRYYIDWAEQSLAWFLRTGMINDEGTINDGLTQDGCANNNGTAWSYNQGVILGALVEFNIVAPNHNYLALAHKIAHAALRTLSDTNGVIHDVCEPDCGADGTQFKGIFMRNMVRLHQVEPRRLYAESIRVNAESVWTNGRGDSGVLGVNWAGPFVPPGDASTHSSAMDVLVADVLVGRQ